MEAWDVDVYIKPAKSVPKKATTNAKIPECHRQTLIGQKISLVVSSLEKGKWINKATVAALTDRSVQLKVSNRHFSYYRMTRLLS